MTIRRQTATEEIANSLSHGFGALLAVAGLIALLHQTIRVGDAWSIVCACVYGGSLVLLYSMSSAYHAAKEPELKRKLRIADHSSVYILIAGTYTPLTLLVLRGGWGWTLFGLVWGLSAVGIVLKFVCFEKFHRISIVLYLSMGWLAVLAIKPMYQRLSKEALLWILAGGLAYSFGVIFYKQEKLRYAHAIWHLFVIAGSALHYVVVYRYLVLFSG